MSQGTSPLLKDKGPAIGPVKTVGTKRLQTDTPSGPGYHNVYVRRKVESEHSKQNPSQELKGNGRDKAKEQDSLQNVQPDQANKPEVTSPITQCGGIVSTESAEKSEVASLIAESEGQRSIESSEKPEVAPPIAESEGQRSTESSEKPEVAPPIAESEGQRSTESSAKPEVASPIAESGGQVSTKCPEKPEVASPMAESGVQVSSESPEMPEVASPIAESGEPASSETPEMPEVASPVAESGGQVSSESPEKPEVASHSAESVGLVSFESLEKTNAEIVLQKSEPLIVPENSARTTVPESEPSTLPTKIVQDDQANKPQMASPIAAAAAQDDTHRSSIQNQYWIERYNRLQTYLENCDRSSQEGYTRMLRSLSAAGRSKHAIELEKRAIHLLVEEGKELQRMKALNVLGKAAPNGSSKQTPLQR